MFHPVENFLIIVTDQIRWSDAIVLKKKEYSCGHHQWRFQVQLQPIYYDS